MIDDRTLKLMRVALDPSAGDAESAAYWERARVELRRSGVRADDLHRPAAPAAVEVGPQIVVDSGPPVEFDVVMPWGKHKGKTLGEIYQQDSRYLDWCMDNAAAMTGSLRRAVEVVCKGA